MLAENKNYTRNFGYLTGTSTTFRSWSKSSVCNRALFIKRQLKRWQIQKHNFETRRKIRTFVFPFRRWSWSLCGAYPANTNQDWSWSRYLAFWAYICIPTSILTYNIKVSKNWDVGTFSGRKFGRVCRPIHDFQVNLQKYITEVFMCYAGGVTRTCGGTQQSSFMYKH